MRQQIVLDKSYMQSMESAAFQELLQTNSFLMPSVLFYELMTTPEPVRSRCFAKIPTTESPFTVITDVGVILNYEIESYANFNRLQEFSINIPYIFNPNLQCDSKYKFTPAERKLLDSWEKYFAERVSRFIILMSDVYASFGNLRSGSSSDRKEKLKEIEEVIATDAEVVCCLYDAICQPELHEPKWPTGDTIDPTWALYRWFQIKILFALDSGFRYQGNPPSPLTEKAYNKFEHDMIDMEYLVHGVLQGALATNENKLSRWFKMLKPDGELLTHLQDYKKF